VGYGAEHSAVYADALAMLHNAADRASRNRLVAMDGAGRCDPDGVRRIGVCARQACRSAVRCVKEKCILSGGRFFKDGFISRRNKHEHPVKIPDARLHIRLSIRNSPKRCVSLRLTKQWENALFGAPNWNLTLRQTEIWTCLPIYSGQLNNKHSHKSIQKII